MRSVFALTGLLGLAPATTVPLYAQSVGIPRGFGASVPSSTSSSGRMPGRSSVALGVPLARVEDVPLPLPLAGPRRVVIDSATGPIVGRTNGAEVLVLRVPVPPSVRLDASMSLRPVEYRIVAGRHVQLLGNAVGRLDIMRDTALVVALRIARRAPAGRSLGGTVEFRVGTVNALVPFDIEVPTQRQLSLQLASRTLLATRGRWNTLPLRVSNAGNVEELTSISVAVPRGWRSEIRGTQRTQRLAAGSSADYAVRLWIPPQASAGLTILPVRLVRPGERDTTEQVQVDIMPDLQREQQGARITTSFIGGRTPDGLSASAYSLGVDGQLSDSTLVTGRITYANASSLSDSRGLLLARSGMFAGPPSLEIRHPRLLVQAGATVTAAAELGGQNVAGVGGAIELRHGRLLVRGFDLRPMGFGNSVGLLAVGSGHLYGGEVGVTTGAMRTSLFGSALREAFTRRSRQAQGVRIALGRAGSAQLLTEVAYRDAGTTRGVGASNILQYTGRRTFLEARVLHAPGGSQAFARATEEFNVTASRAFAERAFVSLGGWRQRDASRLIGNVENSGWSFAPAVQVPFIGTLGVEARGAHFASTLDSTRLENEERSGGAMWTADVMGMSLIGRAALARIDRALAADTWQSRTRQWRVDHSVSLVRGGARGVMQVNWNYQQFSAPGGNLPAQQAMQLRLEHLRPRLSTPVYFDAEVQRVQVGPQRAPFWAGRAGVTAELPGALSVTVAAEHSPFVLLSTARGGRPIGYTMRVDRTTGTPRLFSGARNRVFRDDNGNGRFDRGERGVPGVVIQCGTRPVQTDVDGRFACAEREQLLDPRTLPVGLVPASARVIAGAPVALRVMHPLRIRLRVGQNDTLRLRVGDLSDAVVFARDSSGMSWYARATRDGEFVVDALPIGRYTIGVDGSALSEPLSASGADPVVSISGVAAPSLVEIELRARPVRLKTFDAGSIPVPTAQQPLPAPRVLNRAPTVPPRSKP